MKLTILVPQLNFYPLHLYLFLGTDDHSHSSRLATKPRFQQEKQGQQFQTEMTIDSPYMTRFMWTFIVNNY